MRFTYTLTQFALILISGLLWATMPEGTPSLDWRLHFGIASYLCGIVTGIAFGLNRSKNWNG